MTEIEVSTQGGVDSQEQAWDLFEVRLAAYLATMEHAEDRLVLETPDSGGDATAPYAQVDVVRPGVLRAELSGNSVLEKVHRLDKAGKRAVRELGWDAPDRAHGFVNFHTELELADVDVLAQMIRAALGETFRLADPELLSYRAWGPAAGEATALGLASTEDVPTDRVGGSGRTSTSATVPDGRDDLLALVGETLAELFDDEVELDEDTDFVLDHGHRSYVRVREDEPTIEVFTRLVHDVDSRRRTAVELSILNREVRWAKFYLGERSVYMTLTLPGSPYSAAHVRALVPRFEQTVLEVRDDLALRTGGMPG
jgi:hypothetical protein